MEREWRGERMEKREKGEEAAQKRGDEDEINGREWIAKE